jgi:hypothetical protein
MKTPSIATSVSLLHQTTLRIPDAAGLEITCTSGSLWLTLDNDPRDVILTAGSAESTFSTQEHRTALIYALADSHVFVAAVKARAVHTQCASMHARCASQTERAMLPLVPA